MMTLGPAAVPVVADDTSAISVVSEVRISSRSTWSDRRWVFDGRRPGLVDHDFIVDWSFELPGGSCFTDPQWAALLEAARRYLWTLATDPPPGRGSTRSLTLITVFCQLRLLIRWMIEQRYTCFADLDRDATGRFIATVAERCGRAGTRLAPTTLNQFRRLLLTLYQQRGKLPDAPREHPFGGWSARASRRFSASKSAASSSTHRRTAPRPSPICAGASTRQRPVRTAIRIAGSHLRL